MIPSCPHTVDKTYIFFVLFLHARVAARRQCTDGRREVRIEVSRDAVAARVVLGGRARDDDKLRSRLAALSYVFKEPQAV